MSLSSVSIRSVKGLFGPLGCLNWWDSAVMFWQKFLLIASGYRFRCSDFCSQIGKDCAAGSSALISDCHRGTKSTKGQWDYHYSKRNVKKSFSPCIFVWGNGDLKKNQECKRGDPRESKSCYCLYARWTIRNTKCQMQQHKLLSFVSLIEIKNKKKRKENCVWEHE